MERFGLGNAGTEPGSGGSGTGGMGQTGKKKPKKQPFSRTYRFSLSLDVTEDDGDKSQLYPDFNWLDLVAQEEEKKLEDKKKQVLDPFGSDDDDVKVRIKEISIFVKIKNSYSLLSGLIENEELCQILRFC